MLKVSANKPIAGYAPCPECQTLAAVHFPNGGRRANTPYLSCGGCNKTIQASTTKTHIKEHYAPTLEDYSERFDTDVSAELEQVEANKWTENPALYDVKMNGLVDESPESLLGEQASPSEEDSVIIDNDTQQVVDEKETPQKPQDSGSGVWLMVLLAVLLMVSVGGYLLIKRRKRKTLASEPKQEGKADE